MVDEPDPPLVFRNAYEARAHQIAEALDAPALTGDPVRLGHLRSFDYTGGGLVLTAQETAGGRAFRFEVLPTKTSETAVRRELTKAISAYDRAK